MRSAKCCRQTLSRLSEQEVESKVSKYIIALQHHVQLACCDLHNGGAIQTADTAAEVVVVAVAAAARVKSPVR